MNSILKIVQSVYHTFVQIRNYFYNHELLHASNTGVPVVSVGSLTFGGSGKTPVVICLARELHTAGFRVVILSRGYKRKSRFTRIVSTTEKILLSRRRAGDEPFLMANRLPGIPVIVSAKRVKGAAKARRRFKPDVILLDDGFQHRKIHRSVDIVLLDSPDILDNNTFLREPVKNLRRADVVIFTKYNRYENAAEIQQQMVSRFSCPVFPAFYASRALRNEREELPASVLRKKTVWLIAGIGKPDYFKYTVENAGSHVSRTFFYRDHAHYSRWRMRKIIRKFRGSSANYLITTEKDWHKLKRWVPRDIPCYYLDIDVEIKRASLLMKIIYDATYLQKNVEMFE